MVRSSVASRLLIRESVGGEQLLMSAPDPRHDPAPVTSRARDSAGVTPDRHPQEHRPVLDR
jgi:hypothetical protein